MSAKLDPALIALLNTPAPEPTPVDAIVRVARADDETEAALTTLGLQVRLRTQLIPSFAVTGPVEALAKLADQPWVAAVELDRPVRAL
ncbi:MAG: hypothetical protein NZ528_15515 [Caldilineales bacterium]|nr:hypothetical protein [Caldilineales bacterium]MDW8316351.1 hypothetical protein [Anaerolineae bacterium]